MFSYIELQILVIAVQTGYYYYVQMFLVGSIFYIVQPTAGAVIGNVGKARPVKMIAFSNAIVIQQWDDREVPQKL